MAVYCAALAAAVYSQTFAIFVGFAHMAWAGFRTDRKTASLCAAANLLAIAAFSPWYIYARTHWSTNIVSAGYHFAFSPKTPLMLLREFAGAGYWGSGLILILCALGISQRVKNAEAAWFLVPLAVVPILLALVADGLFGYFVATRQIIWVLPALAVLSSLAIERAPRIAVPAALLLAVCCVWQTARYFTAPKENWQLAADILQREVKQGACLIIVPPEQIYLYEFFHPDLAHSRCPAPRTVVAAIPYATNAQRDAAIADMTAQGYSSQPAIDAGKTLIWRYSR
jgi:hypothetical protein